MDLISIEGLLVILLFVFPGAVGDIVMREILNMLPPRSDFRQLTSAVAWSLSALLAVEAVAGIFKGSFGDYLIGPVLQLGSAGEGVGSVASRWLVFALVAAVLPWFVRRYVLQPTMSRLEKQGYSFRTLQASSLDKALEKAHAQTPEGDLPARITTNEGTIKGFVVWSTQGREEDAALILQTSKGDKTLTWVPARSIVSLELFDSPGRVSDQEDPRVLEEE